MNNTVVPKLRFPEFVGKEGWVEKAFFDGILKEHKLKSDGKSEVCSVSVHKGVVNQIEHLGRSFSADDTSNYKLVKPGDIIYTKSPTGNFPYGIIKQHLRGDTVIVSPLYGVFSPINKWVGFLIHSYFEYSTKTNNFLAPIIQKGAKNTIQISNDTFLSKGIPLPSIRNEQQKVAEFILSLDELILAETEKLGALKIYKSGLVQQLFPSDGETVPQLRFSEFENEREWQRKPFNKVFARITTKNRENNQNTLTISAQLGLVNQLDYFNKTIAASDLSGYYLLHKGDFAYNKSYSQGYPMGAIKRLKYYEKGVVSTLYICFRIKSEDNPSFFEQYFDAGLLNSEINQIAQEGARNHGLLNIGVKDFFEKIELLIPSKIEEQQKIADCLSSIDELIDAQNQKVVTLKEHKRGIIQQLFPTIE